MACAIGSGYDRKEYCFNRGRAAGLRSEYHYGTAVRSKTKPYCQNAMIGPLKLRLMGYVWGDNSKCYQRGFELGQDDRRNLSARRRKPPVEMRKRFSFSAKREPKLTRQKTPKYRPSPPTPRKSVRRPYMRF